MNVLVTGGTGFIGSRLVLSLCQQGHQVTVFSRQKSPRFIHQAVNFCKNLTNLHHLNEIDIVINLAGEPIFDKRWCKRQKQVLQDSRLHITAQLVDLIQKSENPPHTFISASATGYYGDLPQKGFCDESAKNGKNFTACLCQKWEEEARKAETKTRLCLIRTGMVLSPEGGALKQMLPLYRANLAGKLGGGKQYWAWITLDDYLNAIHFLIANPQCVGVYNVVAPEPIPQYQFHRWLSQQCHRFACLNVPTFALRFVLGERADLLLDNQPILPKHLLEQGFHFNTASLWDYQLRSIKQM